MKIYYDGVSEEYFTEYDHVPATAELIVDEPFSKGAFEALCCTAEEFVRLLAMFEEEDTCFENVIEEWQNEEEFVMNHNIYAGDILTIPDLIKRCLSHAVYFKSSSEFAAYVNELAMTLGCNEAEAEERLFDANTGDVYLVMLTKIPGVGGHSSCEC